MPSDSGRTPPPEAPPPLHAFLTACRAMSCDVEEALEAVARTASAAVAVSEHNNTNSPSGPGSYPPALPLFLLIPRTAAPTTGTHPAQSIGSTTGTSGTSVSGEHRLASSSGLQALGGPGSGHGTFTRSHTDTTTSSISDDRGVWMSTQSFTRGRLFDATVVAEHRRGPSSAAPAPFICGASAVPSGGTPNSATGSSSTAATASEGKAHVNEASSGEGGRWRWPASSTASSSRGVEEGIDSLSPAGPDAATEAAVSALSLLLGDVPAAHVGAMPFPIPADALPTNPLQVWAGGRRVVQVLLATAVGELRGLERRLPALPATSSTTTSSTAPTTAPDHQAGAAATTTAAAPPMASSSSIVHNGGGGGPTEVFYQRLVSAVVTSSNERFLSVVLPALLPGPAQRECCAAAPAPEGQATPDGVVPPHAYSTCSPVSPYRGLRRLGAVVAAVWGLHHDLSCADSKNKETSDNSPITSEVATLRLLLHGRGALGMPLPSSSSSALQAVRSWTDTMLHVLADDDSDRLGGTDSCGAEASQPATEEGARAFAAALESWLEALEEGGRQPTTSTTTTSANSAAGGTTTASAAPNNTPSSRMVVDGPRVAGVVRFCLTVRLRLLLADVVLSRLLAACRRWEATLDAELVDALGTLRQATGTTASPSPSDVPAHTAVEVSSAEGTETTGAPPPEWSSPLQFPLLLTRAWLHSLLLADHRLVRTRLRPAVLRSAHTLRAAAATSAAATFAAGSGNRTAYFSGNSGLDSVKSGTVTTKNTQSSSALLREWLCDGLGLALTNPTKPTLPGVSAEGQLLLCEAAVIVTTVELASSSAPGIVNPSLPGSQSSSFAAQEHHRAALETAHFVTKTALSAAREVRESPVGAVSAAACAILPILCLLHAEVDERRTASFSTNTKTDNTNSSTTANAFAASSSASPFDILNRSGFTQRGSGHGATGAATSSVGGGNMASVIDSSPKMLLLHEAVRYSPEAKRFAGLPLQAPLAASIIGQPCDRDGGVNGNGGECGGTVWTRPAPHHVLVMTQLFLPSLHLPGAAPLWSPPTAHSIKASTSSRVPPPSTSSRCFGSASGSGVLGGGSFSFNSSSGSDVDDYLHASASAAGTGAEGASRIHPHNDTAAARGDTLARSMLADFYACRAWLPAGPTGDGGGGEDVSGDGDVVGSLPAVLSSLRAIESRAVQCPLLLRGAAANAMSATSTSSGGIVAHCKTCALDALGSTPSQHHAAALRAALGTTTSSSIDGSKPSSSSPTPPPSAVWILRHVMTPFLSTASAEGEEEEGGPHKQRTEDRSGASSVAASPALALWLRGLQRRYGADHWLADPSRTDKTPGPTTTATGPSLLGAVTNDSAATSAAAALLAGAQAAAELSVGAATGPAAAHSPLPILLWLCPAEVLLFLLRPWVRHLRGVQSATPDRARALGALLACGRPLQAFRCAELSRADERLAMMAALRHGRQGNSSSSSGSDGSSHYLPVPAAVLFSRPPAWSFWCDLAASAPANVSGMMPSAVEGPAALPLSRFLPSTHPVAVSAAAAVAAASDADPHTQVNAALDMIQHQWRHKSSKAVSSTTATNHNVEQLADPPLAAAASPAAASTTILHAALLAKPLALLKKESSSHSGTCVAAADATSAAEATSACFLAASREAAAGVAARIFLHDVHVMWARRGNATNGKGKNASGTAKKDARRSSDGGVGGGSHSSRGRPSLVRGHSASTMRPRTASSLSSASSIGLQRAASLRMPVPPTAREPDATTTNTKSVASTEASSGTTSTTTAPLRSCASATLLSGFQRPATASSARTPSAHGRVGGGGGGGSFARTPSSSARPQSSSGRVPSSAGSVPARPRPGSAVAPASAGTFRRTPSAAVPPTAPRGRAPSHHTTSATTSANTSVTVEEEPVAQPSNPASDARPRRSSLRHRRALLDAWVADGDTPSDVGSAASTPPPSELPSLNTSTCAAEASLASVLLAAARPPLAQAGPSRANAPPPPSSRAALSEHNTSGCTPSGGPQTRRADAVRSPGPSLRGAWGPAPTVEQDDTLLGGGGGSWCSAAIGGSRPSTPMRRVAFGSSFVPRSLTPDHQQ